MARWLLKAPAYLMVPGTTYIYQEVDNQGKQARKTYNVPLLIDPDDHDQQNRDKEVIVAYASSAKIGGGNKDIIFSGDPTPDMEPLDDEAAQISAKFTDKWKGIGGFGGDEPMSKRIEASLLQEMITASANAQKPSSDLSEVVAQLAAAQKQTADVLAALAGRR